MTARQALKGAAILSVIGVVVVALNCVERPTDLAADPLDTPSASTAPELAPSSLVLDVSALDPERAYLSIVVDDADLNDPVIGLLANPRGRGRSWERAAQLSYFDPGPRVVWATTAGLRRHGDSSRRSGGRRPSWRLYFRDEYGSDATRRPALPALESAPASLVVRREFRGYPNAIALDIARQNGAVTPAFVPVRTFLNGMDQGNYLLIEHVSPRGWGRSHFGHDDFLMFIDRSQSGDDRSQRRYEQLVTWVETAPSPLSMAAVDDRVDLDNLLLHLFTFIFCGTTDWNQGAAVLDNTAARARWSWVHWDLDQSFYPRKRRSLDDPRSVGWETSQPAIGQIIESGKRRDVRARIFDRLRQEDPDFVAHFTALATNLLNHRLGTAFSDHLMNKYEHLMRGGQVDEFRKVFAARPEIVRADLRAYFDAGPSHQVAVDGPPGLALEIDGYAESSGYRGWYIAGTPIRVSLADNDQGVVSHWIVNGQRRDGRQLVERIAGDMAIRVVLK